MKDSGFMPRWGNPMFQLVIGLPLLAGMVLTGCGPDAESASNSGSPLRIQGGLIEDPAPTVANSSLESTENPTIEGIQTSAGPILPAVEAKQDPSGNPIDPAATKKTKAGMANALEPGFTEVNFDTLASFTYDMPEGEFKKVSEDDPAPQVVTQIPESIRKFDQTDVALMGFMLPLKVEKGLVTEMLIMRDQSMCCYGTVPKINEWVNVRMRDKGVKPIMDQPVTLFGTLHVGEVYENDYLVGIYEMDGEKMDATIDP